MGEYRMYRMSDLSTIEMRITAQLVSRGALILDDQQEKDHAIQRRVRELAPKVEARDMTLRAAVDEIIARPFRARH